MFRSLLPLAALLSCSPGPRPVVDASPTMGPVPLTVRFDGSASEGHSALSPLRWDFDDGDEAEGEVVDHVFTVSGDYTVRLTAVDDASREATAEVVISADPAQCPDYGEPQTVGHVEEASLVEASGLVSSIRHPGVMWAHNDSGDLPQLFAMSTTGASLGTVRLGGAAAWDWEDLAIGPGPDGTPHLFAADIGDNPGSRSHIAIYRVPEPDLPTDAGTTIVQNWVALEASYPDGAHDAEAMVVDPISADLFIVTKEDDGRSQVFRYPSPQRPAERVELESVGTVVFGEGPTAGSPQLTAMDISPLGTGLLARTYTHAFLWLRDGGTLLDALAREPCRVPVALEPQGEAIAFAAQGWSFVTISEGSAAAVHLVADGVDAGR